MVAPTHRLAGEVRQVADGDLDHQVLAAGPREITELGEDVEAMRVLIVARAGRHRAGPRSELDAAGRELARSNSELEQFAYVASHDLQEPLRKVASFCQLLQRRYAGQLDERADQYIEFAVDGAKRMQVLINDLLAFSRVGRHERRERRRSTCDRARRPGRSSNLAGAHRGDRRRRRARRPAAGCAATPALLTTVFQNLLGNALKFRGDGPAPRCASTPSATATAGCSRCRDNGIGIEPEYADRIFVIFQRLHPAGRLPGHRHRAGHVPEDRRVPRRHDLAGHRRTTARAPPSAFTLPGDARSRQPDTAQEAPDRRDRPPLNVIDVLLVEDDPGDVLMTQEAFEHHKIAQHTCTSWPTASRRWRSCAARASTPTRRARA